MQTFPPPGEPQTFVELLAFAARGGGDRVAFRQRVRNEWHRRTFRELNEHARALAAGLVAMGLKPGDRVVIILENCVDWPVAFYAIESAGAVAVPIYYGLKPDEVTAMLAHVEPAMAVVSGDTVQKLGDPAARLAAVIVVDDDRGVTKARSVVPPGPVVLTLAEAEGRGTDESRRQVDRVTVQPDDLAAILFTSGTSAGHKGVMLTHRNVLANVAQARRVIPFGPKDRLLLVLPMHHSFPFMIGLGLLPALTAELVFENDLRRIRDRMQEVRPTLFLGVPALFEIMHRNVLQAIETQGRMAAFHKAQKVARLVKRITGVNIGGLLFKDLHQRLGGELKLMVSGGAALNPEIQREFLLLGIPLIQGWGLTESSPALALQQYSRWRFRFTRYYEKRIGSIGKPLPGVEIQLMDVPEKGLFVNVHHEGELIARGPNITPGYWRAPELTESLKAGEWLKTGDLGTIDRHGDVRITGRSKFIIVLDSGEKVYPDEVEEKLGMAPAIEDIAVRAIDVRGRAHVAAVVYPNRDEALKALGGRAPTPDNVREVVVAAVRAHEKGVATFKRVVDVMITDEPLPRTPLRKIMRGQLRAAYTFDPDRWAQTWAELAASTAE